MVLIHWSIIYSHCVVYHLDVSVVEIITERTNYNTRVGARNLLSAVDGVSYYAGTCIIAYISDLDPRSKIQDRPLPPNQIRVYYNRIIELR